MSYSKPATIATLGATGTAVSGPCVIKMFHLVATSDTATARIYDGDTIPANLKAALSAATLTGDDITIECGMRFVRECRVVLTGTAPVLTFAVDLPRANVT